MECKNRVRDGVRVTLRDACMQCMRFFAGGGGGGGGYAWITAGKGGDGIGGMTSGGRFGSLSFAS